MSLVWALRHRGNCGGMTVNYTAAQSEMMLPLLRRRRGMKRRELARNRFCLVARGGHRLRSNGERGRGAVSPKLRNHFPPSIMAAGAASGGGGAEGHDRCQRGVMAMNSKSSPLPRCVWRHRHGRRKGLSVDSQAMHTFGQRVVKSK